MFAELAIASAMVLLTVAGHALGLWGLQRLFQRRLGAARAPASLQRPLLFALLVLGLFALHGLEIWAYAALYRVLDAIPNLRSAVYFSTITYGAIGYSDAEMSSRWRLVAAIEGVNGVLLIGWTTAFFVTLMTRLQRSTRRRQAPKEGA